MTTWHLTFDEWETTGGIFVRSTLANRTPYVGERSTAFVAGFDPKWWNDHLPAWLISLAISRNQS